MAVTSCAYNMNLRQLTVKYNMNNGKDSRQVHSITVTTFKNPVSVGAKTGFMVTSEDSEGRNIGQSPVLMLGGITKPTGFDSVKFSFDDTNRMGEYSSFRINLKMKVPTEQNCFFKVKFPEQFTLDEKLTGM